ncbi:MAG TPA: hypothetical protein VIW67_16525 [Terriglobales bacterium]
MADSHEWISNHEIDPHDEAPQEEEPKRQATKDPFALHFGGAVMKEAEKHPEEVEAKLMTLLNVLLPALKRPDTTQTARTIPYYFAAFAGFIYAVGFLVEFTFMNSMGIKDSLTEAFKAKHIYIGILCLFFPASMIITILSTAKLRRILLNNPTELNKLTVKMIIPSGALFVAFLSAFYLLIAFSRPNTFQEHTLEFFTIFVLSVMGPSLTWIVHKRIHAATAAVEAARSKREDDLNTRRTAAIKEALQQMKGSSEEDIARSIGIAVHEITAKIGSDHGVVNAEEFAKLWNRFKVSIWISWLLVIVTAGLTFYIFWGLRAELIEMVKEGGYLHFGLLLLAGFLLWRWDLGNERRKTQDPETRAPATMVTMALVCPLVYLSVLAFGGRIYCYIPVHRGGGDFTTESSALLQFDPHHTNSIPISIIDTSKQNLQSRPLFIVQQNNSAYFLALPTTNNNPWTWRHLGITNKPSEIIMIRRDAVVSYRYRQVP